MKPGWLFALAAPASLFFAPAPACAADPPGCPPGEWFCDDASGDPEGPLSPEEGQQGAPPDDVDGPLPDDQNGELAPSEDEREFDVRSPAPPVVSDSGWGEAGRDASPWALAMRVQGLFFDGKRRRDDAHLGGVGVSGRYALNPVVTLDLGLDSIVGTDYNGYDRSELSLSFSSLFYLNYHPIVRTYVLVGLNTSRARVDVDGDDQTWGYFGGQTGLGLDITLDHRVVLNFDAIAFMRGRTDSRAERQPEFTDGLGRVTNTSGGGLLRGGVSLRF